ncbi:lytic transglycosylase domain-containing protein [Paracoccus pantotrophus]|uniref:lytic transglycosylase domain-containing protein n=1 Tax=Paracoccus pantotrophus TaxID=82367 RepID=UPI0009456138|nr:lytic transglycosylase domain-containing protein [Paracoccus pantotrophus]MDF3855623.1 lytic transglycosylase domain-containing protein [Paracoccus pantotrophus]
MLALGTVSVPGSVLAQGVPNIDARGIAEMLQQMEQDRAERRAEVDENSKRQEMLDKHDEQLAALDETLELLTGASAFVPDLEGGGAGGAAYAASTVYAIDDNNPYVDRIMGDAPVTIEQMIAETAVKYGNHPALAKAGINVVEFRCWFQALVKQESNFSIGARSPKAAFGLTQIIPDTATYLGINPAYYDDPRLQLDGGARYLLEQLNRFGSMPMALAAYNAGPGAVQKYNGIPPYKETQDYVVKISGYYDRYAARMNGAADAVGTLDPRDMAIAEASNVADAGWHYAAHSMDTMSAAAARLRSILVRIESATSVKEAMDLNTYARGETARMANIVVRLAATQRKVEAARNALLIQAYIEDEKYLQVRVD